MSASAWTADIRPKRDGRVLLHVVKQQAADVSYRKVLELWRDDGAFRDYFNRLLADVPFQDFRWETPAVTASTVERPFEFVVLDSPGLAPVPEPEAFAEHFARAKSDVVTFANLRGDARLVVPCPRAADRAYKHVGAFVREAPPAQSDELWRQVGLAMFERLGDAPVWLSTAGAGVSWLHVRLDSTPKYYGYAPYREPPQEQGP
jgi:hypothetical protein